MDESPITLTSILLILLCIILIGMLLYHCFGNRETIWSKSYKEEKVGLSAHTFFKSNGYMIHSGSELLLSSSGSFKRFDSVDKDGCKQQQQQQQHQHRQHYQQFQYSAQHQQQTQNSPKHSTTALWNLAHDNDCEIPPQPLRPAPAPVPAATATASGVLSHSPPRTVTFSLNLTNEASSDFSTEDSINSNEMFSRNLKLVNDMLQKKHNVEIPALEGPPIQTKILNNIANIIPASAIPRPQIKKTSPQELQQQQQQQQPSSPQRYFFIEDNPKSSSGSGSESDPDQLQQHQTINNTNPFLVHIPEPVPQLNINSNTALNLNDKQTTNNQSKSEQKNPFWETTSEQTATTTTTTTTTPTTTAAATFAATLQQNIGAKLNGGLPISFRNRSYSETATPEENEHSSGITLKNLTNAFQAATTTTSPASANCSPSPTANPKPGNPFSHVARKIKGPHMLHKTISEDFLFRKTSPAAETAGGDVSQQHSPNAYFGLNGNSAASTTNGNGTWSFGRMLKQEDCSAFNLWRRNSSQNSLDSGSTISLDSVNLERAISCDSVDSDLSGNGFNIQLDQSTYTQITGNLCVGIHYDKNTLTTEGHDLQVTVKEAKDLVLPFNVESLDTFVRIYLVPDQAGALQTQVITNSATPCFNETFDFWLNRKNLRHSLWFHLYHNGDAHTLIGEAEMEISELPKTITTWIPLSDSRKCNAKWGELMFSLSYLPTAERLTIVVVKARNLKLQVPSKHDPNILQDVQSIFVKVYLMNKDKKVLKKRTSMKRIDRCPVFNESVIFSLPPQNLTTAQLRLTVFGVVAGGGGAGDESTITPLGHVLVGACTCGKGLRHWHHMLSSLRKPVCMWHVLRRVSNQPIFTGGADAVVAAMQTTAQRSKRNSVF